MSHAGGQSNGQGCNHKFNYSPDEGSHCIWCHEREPECPKPAPRWRPCTPNKAQAYKVKLVSGDVGYCWFYLNVRKWAHLYSAQPTDEKNKECCEFEQKHINCCVHDGYDILEWLDDQGVEMAGGIVIPSRHVTAGTASTLPSGNPKWWGIDPGDDQGAAQEKVEPARATGDVNSLLHSSPAAAHHQREEAAPVTAGQGNQERNAPAKQSSSHPLGTRALEAAMAFRPDGKRFGGRPND